MRRLVVRDDKHAEAMLSGANPDDAWTDQPGAHPAGG